MTQQQLQDTNITWANIDKTHLLLIAAALGLGVYVLASSGKKKSVHGPADYIVPLGIVALLGYGAYKLFSGGLLSNLLGSKSNDTNNQAVAASNAQAVQNTLNQLKAAGDPSTINSAQAAAIANTVYTLGAKGNGYASSADQDTIVYDIINASSLTDLLNIIQAFGTKQVSTGFWSTCSLLGFNCNAVGMPEFLHLCLDESHLASLNSFLSAQNISYQF
jgi:hypothetical protein